MKCVWEWFSANSGAVQALGTIVALGIAIYVPWQQHRKGAALAEKRDQEDRLRRMETAASIAINAMNRIQEAWESLVKNPGSTSGYEMMGFSRYEFEQAAEALREINLSDLTAWEMVRPILEMRSLVLRAANLAECVFQGEHDYSCDPDECRSALDDVYREANKHTETIETLVNDLRS